MSMKADKILQCPICLETMTKPILQCKVGHSMCGDCLTTNCITLCPQCRGPLSKTRNYQLEQLLECVKIPCFFADNGCNFRLSNKEKEQHEAECKNRLFTCEGKNFAKWNCKWKGTITDMHQHFKEHHKNHTWVEYRTEAVMKISFQNDFHDVQIISFFNGSQYFWYKHKVDVAKKRAYWTFQFIGPKKQAHHYYYEFEVFQGPVHKFKITEICENDVVKAEDIFESEKCVVLSFATIKNFLDDNGELPFKFRLMAIKKQPTGNSK